MATINYSIKGCLASCDPGQTEVQQGDSIKLTVTQKNPDWPETVVGTLTAPAYYDSESGLRVYQIEYDETVFGSFLPQACDFTDAVCYSCCDRLEDALRAWTPLRDNGNGTFTIVNYDGTTGATLTSA